MAEAKIYDLWEIRYIFRTDLFVLKSQSDL